MQFLLWHPLLFFWNITGYGGTGFAIIGVCASAFYILITRVMAEIPGHKYGNAVVWWIIFFVFHFYGVAIYWLYDFAVSNLTSRYLQGRKVKFAKLDSGSIEKYLAHAENRQEMTQTVSREIDELTEEGSFDEALEIVRKLREIFLKENNRQAVDRFDVLVEQIAEKQIRYKSNLHAQSGSDEYGSGSG